MPVQPECRFLPVHPPSASARTSFILSRQETFAQRRPEHPNAPEHLNAIPSPHKCHSERSEASKSHIAGRTCM